MKRNETGFTTIELVMALGIIAIIGFGAMITTYQVLYCNERNNNHVTALQQVQNAGFWISRDTQMAQTVTTDDLTLPDFLVMTWTEDVDGTPIYHSATYTLEDLTDGVARLKRNHWSSAGVNEDTLIADYVYYNASDVDNTSQASYTSPLLTLQLTTLIEEKMETREYIIKNRPNL